MAGDNTTTIRVMTLDDLPGADQLRALAGWNQLPCDWMRILNYQPDGCFVAAITERIVGTVTTTCYPGIGNGPSLAWIGMMLVHPDYRRQGIGTQLMNRALEFLRGAGIDCIKLDATPAGAPVYKRLGFREEWEFNRWQKKRCERSSEFLPGTQTLPPPGLDERAFGADRSHWLKILATDSDMLTTDTSFGMIRHGADASYLGPITAAHADTASEFVVALLRKVSGPVFWDIPSPNKPCEQLAREHGFEPVRTLTRMWTGREVIQPDLQLQFGLSDPGTG